MWRQKREPQPVFEPTELLELGELEEQHVIELPDREAISIVNGAMALTAGAAVSAGLLPSP